MESASRKEGSEMLSDDIKDDQSIVIKTDCGLVVILGCAHRGMINHLLHAQKITGINEIKHCGRRVPLFNAPKSQVERTVAATEGFDIKRIGVSHCTGMKPSFAMMHAFGDRFFFNNTGTITKIPPET